MTSPTRNRHLRAASKADDTGGVLVIVALTLLVLLGLSAVVIDLGVMRWDKRASQTAADMASVAGAMDLPFDGDGSGLAACQTAWAYVLENSPIETQAGSDPCVNGVVEGDFGVDECNANDSANIAEHVADPYVVRIIWPIPDGSEWLVDRDDEGDGEACERIAVQIERQRGFLLAGIFDVIGSGTGMSSGFTTAPAVAWSGEEGEEDVIASLVVLEREACDAITADGQGKIHVVHNPDLNQPGIIAVDSAGSLGPPSCGNNKYVIDPGTSHGEIKAGVDVEGNIDNGIIYSWALSQGNEDGAFRPNTFPRLAPRPTRAPRMITRAIAEHVYNCKESYPEITPSIEGCPDYEDIPPHIHHLVDYVGAAGLPPGEYDNEDYEEYFDGLEFETYTEYANDEYGEAPGFNPCNMSSGDPTIELPARDGWYIDCASWSFNNEVHIEGGNVVTDGSVSLGAAAKLSLNGTADEPIEADSQFLYIRQGNLSKTGQSELLFHRTFVYLHAGRLDLGGNDGALLWTAPREEDYLFDKLALWSGGSSQQHRITGQGDLNLQGVFYVPRATFRISGQGTQVQDADAQFISNRLEVGGQATIRVTPSEDFSLPFPLQGVRLIR